MFEKTLQNIMVEETLQEKRALLYQEKTDLEQQDQKILVETVSKIVNTIHPLFSEYNIVVSSDRILFQNEHSDCFRIERDRNWSTETTTFNPAKLSYSSSSNSTDKDLKISICIGKIAELILVNSPIWTALWTVMDIAHEAGKNEKYKTIYTQIHEIDTTISNIKKQEQTDKFTKVFNAGKFELNKQITHYYGNGKYDRVTSSKWEWNANGSGKTYLLHYYWQQRVNPYYDEDNNVLEPEYKEAKHAIPKRIRKADLECFVRTYLFNIKS